VEAAPRFRSRNFQECIMKQHTTTYVLGSSDQEIERLDRQSASIEGATRLLLRAAGIGKSRQGVEGGVDLAGEVNRRVRRLRRWRDSPTQRSRRSVVACSQE